MDEQAYMEAVAERSDALRKARQQIAELEKENFILNDVLTTQTRRIAELKAAIEQMRLHGNLGGS